MRILTGGPKTPKNPKNPKNPKIHLLYSYIYRNMPKGMSNVLDNGS